MGIPAWVVAEGFCIERHHDRRFVLVPKDVDHAGLKHKMTTLDGREFQPSRDQDTQDMSMGEEENIISDRLGPGNDPVTALGNLLCGITIRSWMGEDRPVRILLADFLGGNPFIVAIVPLGQILGDFRPIAKSSELTGPASPLVGTAEHHLEVPVGESRLERRRLALSLCCQGNFAVGSMSAVLAPLGFTVTDKNDLGA